MKLKFAIMAAAVAFAGSAGAAMAQDAAAGEQIYVKKCKVCHQLGKNAVGPDLTGIIGRKSGSVEGFNYSDANKSSGITWDDKTFKEYIVNPKAKIPGTKMVFAGLPDEKERNDLTAYLATLKK
jgi:cytochrome c